MPYYIMPNGEALDLDHEPAGARKVSKKEFTAARREHARQQLLEILQPGQYIHTVTVREGQGTGHYKVLVPGVDAAYGKPIVRDITHLVATAYGAKLSDKTGGIVMSGYGYSKSFQIVYGLGFTLWPNGTFEPHGFRNGEPDYAGGYALKHWHI